MLKLEGLDSHSIGVNVMRKIEVKMLEAIDKRTSWSEQNTSVEYRNDGAYEYAKIYLHGNHIGTFRYDDRVFYIDHATLAKWPTRTTKSRITALSVAFKTM